MHATSPRPRFEPKPRSGFAQLTFLIEVFVASGVMSLVHSICMNIVGSIEEPLRSPPRVHSPHQRHISPRRPRRGWGDALTRVPWLRAVVAVFCVVVLTLCADSGHSAQRSLGDNDPTVEGERGCDSMVAALMMHNYLSVRFARADEICVSGMTGDIDALPNTATITNCVGGGAMVFNSVQDPSRARQLSITGGKGFGLLTLAMTTTVPYMVTLLDAHFQSGGILMHAVLGRGSKILITGCTFDQVNAVFTDGKGTEATMKELIVQVVGNTLVSASNIYIYWLYAMNTIRNSTFVISGNSVISTTGHVYPYDTPDSGRLFNCEFVFVDNYFEASNSILVRPMQGTVVPQYPIPPDPSKVTEEDMRSIYGRCSLLFQNNSMWARRGTIFFSESGQSMRRSFDIFAIGNNYTASGDLIWNGKYYQTIAFHPIQFVFYENFVNIGGRAIIGVEYKHPIVDGSVIVVKNSYVQSSTNSMSTPYLASFKFSAQVEREVFLMVDNFTMAHKTPGTAPAAISKILHMDASGWTYTSGNAPIINMCNNKLYNTKLVGASLINASINWVAAGSAVIRTRYVKCPDYKPKYFTTPVYEMTAEALVTDSRSLALTRTQELTTSREVTATVSQMVTVTVSTSATQSRSLRPSSSRSGPATRTLTIARSTSLTVSPSTTASLSTSPTASSTRSLTATQLITASASASVSQSSSATSTLGTSVSMTATLSVSISGSISGTQSGPAPTFTQTVVPAPTASQRVTASPSVAVSRSESLSISESLSTTASTSLTLVPTPSHSLSVSESLSSTLTKSSSASATASASASSTESLPKSASLSRSRTTSVTLSRTNSASPSLTSSSSPSVTRPPTQSVSSSVSLSRSASLSASPTGSLSSSHTLVPTRSQSVSISLTSSHSATRSPSPSVSETRSLTASSSNSASQSMTASPSLSTTPSSTQSVSISSSASLSASISASPTPSSSPSVTTSASSTVPPSQSLTRSTSASVTASHSTSVSASTSASLSRSRTANGNTTSATLIGTPSLSPTSSHSHSTSPSATASFSSNTSQTATASPSASPTVSISRSLSAASPSASASLPVSLSRSLAPTPSASASPSTTNTPSPSASASVSKAPTRSETRSGSLTETQSHSKVPTPSETLSPSTTGSHSNASASRSVAPVFLDGRGYLARAMGEMGDNSTVLFIGDPFSLEVQLVTMALVGPCGTASDQSLGRISRYLLSPFVTLGPVGYVGIIHLAATIAVIGAYAAFFFCKRWRNRHTFISATPTLDLDADAAGTTPAGVHREVDRLPLCRELWDAVLFPSVPFAVALFLYPGALYALFSAMRGDSGSQSPLVDLVGAVCGGLQAVLVLAVALYPAVRAKALGEFSSVTTNRSDDGKDKQKENKKSFIAAIVGLSGWWYSLAAGRPAEGSVGLLLARGFAGAAPRTPRAIAASCFVPSLLVAVACVGAALLPIEAYVDGSGNGEKYIGDTRDQVPAITSCAYRQYAAGAALLVLAVAVAALRPMLTLLANVLTVVSLAACAAVIVIGGVEASSGYDGAGASGSTLWAVRLVAMVFVFAATTARFVHIIVAMVLVIRRGPPTNANANATNALGGSPQRQNDYDIVSVDRMGEEEEEDDVEGDHSNGGLFSPKENDSGAGDGDADRVMVSFSHSEDVALSRAPAHRTDGGFGQRSAMLSRALGDSFEEVEDVDAEDNEEDAVEVDQQETCPNAFDDGFAELLASGGGTAAAAAAPHDGSAVPTVVSPTLTSAHPAPAAMDDEIILWSRGGDDDEDDDESDDVLIEHAKPSPTAAGIDGDASGSGGRSGDDEGAVIALQSVPRAATNRFFGRCEDEASGEDSYVGDEDEEDSYRGSSGSDPERSAVLNRPAEFEEEAPESEPSVAEAVDGAWDDFFSAETETPTASRAAQPAVRAFGVHGFGDDSDRSGDVDASRGRSSPSDDVDEHIREECMNSEDDYY